MILNKKFYNAEEGAGGSETAVAEAPKSIAEIMATQGIKDGNLAEKPLENKEAKEEVKPETETTAATATVEEKGEAKTETSAVKKEEVVADTKKEETTTNQQTWQEVLKNQQPTQVLKELGFDDETAAFVNGLKELDPKMVAFLNIWKDGGDVTGYLKEYTTDYSKMSAEEVMRNQLKAEYPKASEAAINAIYKDEVERKYNLDSDDDDEVAEGRLKLEAKADKYRDTLIEQQQSKLLPKAPEKNNDAELAEQKQEQERARLLSDYTKRITDNPYTQTLQSSKQLAIGEGEDSFNYPVANPSDIVELLFDDNKLRQKLFIAKADTNGQTIYEPDIKKQMFIAAAANDLDGLISSLAQHYKSLGGKKTVDSIENAKVKDLQGVTTSTSVPTTAAAAMASKGRRVD